MEIKKMKEKIYCLFEKHKYAVVVLLIGLSLLLIPNNKGKSQKVIRTSTTMTEQKILTEESLVQILQSVAGAGKVNVLLSRSTGEETVYQTDTDRASAGDSGEENIKTIVITDSQKNEAGLVRQVNPASYKGAIVVCQGADSPTVRLAITEAVSKITGLGTDAICVLKME